MVGQLAQVARYLARSELDGAGTTLDERIRARVAESFADEPTVVVAHSLGTVIALELLHQYGSKVDLQSAAATLADLLELAVDGRTAEARAAQKRIGEGPTP